MKDPIWDIESLEPFVPVSDQFALGLDGRMRMRVNDNLSMDMESGELHFTTPWTVPDDGGED